MTPGDGDGPRPWRVVMAGGEVRDTPVKMKETPWDGDRALFVQLGPDRWRSTRFRDPDFERDAVVEAAAAERWPIAAVLAPGQDPADASAAAEAEHRRAEVASVRAELESARRDLREARAAGDLADAERAEAQAAAGHAAQAHAQDLAALAAVLGLAPGGPFAVLWRRARSAWLLVRRAGLEGKAVAVDAEVRLPPDVEPPTGDVAALCAELARLRAFVAEIGAKDVPCRCGSGAHPRGCDRHPWALRLHVAEMNARDPEEEERAAAAAVKAERDACADVAYRAESAWARAEKIDGCDYAGNRRAAREIGDAILGRRWLTADGAPPAPLTRCASDCDGDCDHPLCPQLRDGEPKRTGRHCPLDRRAAEET